MPVGLRSLVWAQNAEVRKAGLATAGTAGLAVSHAHESGIIADVYRVMAWPTVPCVDHMVIGRRHIIRVTHVAMADAAHRAVV